MNPTQKRALIFTMRADGATLQEIGDAVGLGKTGVWGILKRGYGKAPARVANPRCIKGCGRGHAWGALDQMCARCRAGRPAPLTVQERAERASAQAAAANRRRSERAAERTIAGARERLEDGRPITEQQQRVLRARIDHPDWSLAQLGAELGMTKDSYATTLRRAIASTSAGQRWAA